jgi:hypothetical protein
MVLITHNLNLSLYDRSARHGAERTQLEEKRTSIRGTAKRGHRLCGSLDYFGCAGIPKSKLRSHQISYDSRSGLWTGDLSSNVGSVGHWGVVGAKEGKAANGDQYVDISIHFDVCQALTTQDADTSYIVASTLKFGTVAPGLWYLEPEQTFTFEQKEGEMQLKAKMKHVDKGMISLYPAGTKKEHGMYGPFKYDSFIIATCKQDTCKLWNDLVVPRTTFPQ